MQREPLQAGAFTLLWGDRSALKARLREESLKRHLSLPLAERLKAALSLLTRGTPGRAR